MLVDLESDIVKKVDGPARLPRACFIFKMALKSILSLVSKSRLQACATPASVF